jgi:hypothetical protein
MPPKRGHIRWHPLDHGRMPLRRRRDRYEIGRARHLSALARCPNGHRAGSPSAEPYYPRESTELAAQRCHLTLLGRVRERRPRLTATMVASEACRS